MTTEETRAANRRVGANLRRMADLMIADPTGVAVVGPDSVTFVPSIEADERWTTCSCPDGKHVDPKALKRSHRLHMDAAIIARHTGRHVVPVSEIRTEVPA